MTADEQRVQARLQQKPRYPASAGRAVFESVSFLKRKDAEPR
jgi:hypothetical protein